MKHRIASGAKRGLGGLLVLSLLFSATGCRMARARNLEDRIDRLENRVTALEAKQDVQLKSD